MKVSSSVLFPAFVCLNFSKFLVGVAVFLWCVEEATRGQFLETVGSSWKSHVNSITCVSMECPKNSTIDSFEKVTPAYMSRSRRVLDSPYSIYPFYPSCKQLAFSLFSFLDCCHLSMCFPFLLILPHAPCHDFTHLCPCQAYMSSYLSIFFLCFSPFFLI